MKYIYTKSLKCGFILQLEACFNDFNIPSFWCQNGIYNIHLLNTHDNTDP